MGGRRLQQRLPREDRVVTANRKRIQHLIVLMLENRSFDHMLGWLANPPEGLDGLTQNAYYNVDRNGNQVYASTGDQRSGPTPDHSHAGALTQIGSWAGVATCGGFRQVRRRAHAR